MSGSSYSGNISFILQFLGIKKTNDALKEKSTGGALGGSGG